VNAAGNLMGKKIEESVPALREAKAQREQRRAEYSKDSITQPSQIIPSDTVVADPRVPAAGYEMDKRMSPAQQTPQTEEEYAEVTKEPVPLEEPQALVKYPESARRSGIEGRVTFSALVGKDGKVEKVTILHTDNIIFNQAVIDAVKKIHFKPAMQKDMPVRIWYTESVNFKLHSGAAVPDPNSH
jgi:TonB family protein